MHILRTGLMLCRMTASGFIASNIPNTKCMFHQYKCTQTNWPSRTLFLMSQP